MGVTIPDAADYGTPVPRAATTVQSYGVGQPVQQDVAAWTYAAQSAKAAADSDAKAMEGVGVEIAKWSDQLQTTQAQDSLNQLRARRQELTTGDNGFMKVQGGNVVNPAGGQGTSIYETFPTQFQGHADDIGSKLSGKAAMLYKQAMAAEITGFKSDVARHGLAEGEKYRGAVYKDLQAQLDDKIASSSDPAEVDKGIADKIAAATQYAISIGMPGAAAAKAAGSDAAMLVIQKAVNTGDSGAASAALTKYGTYLDAKDRIRVDGLVKTLAQQDTGKGQAQMFMSSGVPTTEGAITGTKQSMLFWQTKDEKGDKYSAPVAAGITAGFLRESQFFTGAKNKGDGRDGSDSIHIGQWNSARAQALAKFVKDNNLDPNDVTTGLKYAKAEIDGVIPYSVSGLSPEFKARLQNAKSEKEAADIMTRGYFRPKYQDGESAHRQGSATTILAKYGGDPLLEAVNRADGVAPAGKDGPDYKDPDVLLFQANEAKARATAANQEANATNSGQRAITQTEIDLLHTAQTRQIDQMRLAQKNELNEVMKTGPTDPKQISPRLWNQLSFRERESVTNIIKHNAKGTEAVTDQNHWYEIQRGLTSADPVERQKWADYDLWQSKDKLDNKDLQELAKMQGVVRKGDPDKQTTHVRNINQLVDDTLLKLKIDSTPKAGSNDATKAYKFRRAVQDQISALEATQPGKKATIEQQQKIVDAMAMEIVTKKGRLWDSTKPRYDFTIKDVPAEDKTNIIDALTRKNAAEAAATKTQPKAISESDIIDAFARKNAQAPK